MARVSRRSVINVEMSEHEFLLFIINLRDTGSGVIMTQDGPINMFCKEVSPAMAKEIDLTMKEVEDGLVR